MMVLIAGPTPGDGGGLTKRCSKCGAEKPLTEFYALRNGRHGRRPECKRCHNGYHNEWARARYVPKGRRDRAEFAPGRGAQILRREGEDDAK